MNRQTKLAMLSYELVVEGNTRGAELISASVFLFRAFMKIIALYVLGISLMQPVVSDFSQFVFFLALEILLGATQVYATVRNRLKTRYVCSLTAAVFWIITIVLNIMQGYSGMFVGGEFIIVVLLLLPLYTSLSLLNVFIALRMALRMYAPELFSRSGIMQRGKRMKMLGKSALKGR